MLAKQVENLACHHRPEFGDPAIRNPHPFVVGAGVADEAIGGDRPIGDRADQLHLLAAHDVGARFVEERDARNDRRPLVLP